MASNCAGSRNPVRGIVFLRRLDVGNHDRHAPLARQPKRPAEDGEFPVGRRELGISELGALTERAAVPFWTDRGRATGYDPTLHTP